MDKKECPKCNAHLREYDLVHREAEGGTVQVTTSYLRCPGCGYEKQVTERQVLASWLVTANTKAKMELDKLFPHTV